MINYVFIDTQLPVKQTNNWKRHTKSGCLLSSCRKRCHIHCHLTPSSPAHHHPPTRWRSTPINSIPSGIMCRGCPSYTLRRVLQPFALLDCPPSDSSIFAHQMPLLDECLSAARSWIEKHKGSVPHSHVFILLAVFFLYSTIVNHVNIF